jgi:hypothetical protein
LINDFVVTGGFDCKVKVWDSAEELRGEVDMTSFFGATGVNPPHVYQIACNGCEILVALGNGHAAVFEFDGALQGKSSWEAHNERIMCCGWDRCLNFIYTASRSDLAVWNESLVKRLVLECKVTYIQPNWIESAQHTLKIYVAGTDNKIHAFSFKH